MSFGKIFTFDIDRENLAVTVKRSFEAPVDLVWAAWTEADLLAQWWAPRPWKAVTKDMDFREGGRWLYAMTSPEGERNWVLETFGNIVPLESFSIHNTFCDEHGIAPPDAMRSTWDNTFAESGRGTLVTNVIRYESEASLDAHIRMGFKEGYGMGLDQLEETLASLRS